MPHYHNFSWYYFLKYVVGFASMLVLYSGFLKEGRFSCVCAPEERIARRKGENACDNYTRSNESCPTGETTDARAKRDVYARSRVLVDVTEEYRAHPPMSMRRSTEAVETAAPQKHCKAKYATNRDLQKYREKLANLSSSDDYIQVRRRRRHLPDCRQTLKHRQGLDPNSSSHSLKKSVARLEVGFKDNCNNRLFDAVARANLQVRNSFAKQEHQELEAFARLVITQGINPHFENSIAASSCSSNPSNFHAKENLTLVDESDEKENFSSDNLESPDYRKIRYRVSYKPYRACKKHYPESPSSSVLSVKSRSGSMYFTASSRRKRPECKIHGHRRTKTSEKPERRTQRCRIIGEYDESNDEIMRKELIVNRQRFGCRRANRYRSRCN